MRRLISSSRSPFMPTTAMLPRSLGSNSPLMLPVRIAIFAFRGSSGMTKTVTGARCPSRTQWAAIRPRIMHVLAKRTPSSGCAKDNPMVVRVLRSSSGPTLAVLAKGRTSSRMIVTIAASRVTPGVVSVVRSPKLPITAEMRITNPAAIPHRLGQVGKMRADEPPRRAVSAGGSAKAARFTVSPSRLGGSVWSAR